ncbi:MAG: hypothetical protein FWC16_00595 [Defluviitaleaceae bacterium]|nr:hypothetical protein [Defluviitaleaceae bacterium]MCL2273402.1 hypothetical protein [Defluviitaleaceae bacterium]
MGIEKIVKVGDLTEPYIRLLDFLNFGDIVNIEQEYRGRQMRFKRDCENVNEEYPDLVYRVGEVKALQVINALGDMWVYFPSIRRSAIDCIYQTIKSEFNGYNTAVLAKKHGYSERHIRRIVGGGRRSPPVMEGQLSLNDIFVTMSIQ